jgi:hypothetical protein
MPKSTYLDNAMLNVVLRNTAYTAPTAVYTALFTAAPTAAGGGTEVSGGGYARQTMAFAAPVSGQCTSNADTTFPQATASWGTVTAFALFDASSAGNMLYYGNLTTSKTINTGDQLKFASGGVTVTES